MYRAYAPFYVKFPAELDHALGARRADAARAAFRAIAQQSRDFEVARVPLRFAGHSMVATSRVTRSGMVLIERGRASN